MSELEPQPDPQPDPLVDAEQVGQAGQQPEPWSAGWSWTVRLSGLAIMGNQAFFEQQDRQWLLLCAMGMMLGEIGLKALLRFLLRDASGGGA